MARRGLTAREFSSLRGHTVAAFHFRSGPHLLIGGCPQEMKMCLMEAKSCKKRCTDHRNHLPRHHQCPLGPL